MQVIERRICTDFNNYDSIACHRMKLEQMIAGLKTLFGKRLRNKIFKHIAVDIKYRDSIINNETLYRRLLDYYDFYQKSCPAEKIRYIKLANKVACNDKVTSHQRLSNLTGA